MDKDVIQVDDTLLAGNSSQNSVHQSLKSCRGITEAKGKDVELLQAPTGDESSFWSGIQGKGHLPVPAT